MEDSFLVSIELNIKEKKFQLNITLTFFQFQLKKFLAKQGTRIIERRKTTTMEEIQKLLELLGYMQQRGLEMMNISNDIRAVIANEKQSKLNQRNISDNNKS